MTPQEKAKQQADVMLAYAEGKEIEFTDVLNPWKFCTDPNWDWLRNQYRVKKPAPKVVKLFGYIDEFKYARYADSYFIAPSQWKRVPSLDLEYTEE